MNAAPNGRRGDFARLREKSIRDAQQLPQAELEAKRRRIGVPVDSGARVTPAVEVVRAKAKARQERKSARYGVVDVARAPPAPAAPKPRKRARWTNLGSAAKAPGQGSAAGGQNPAKDPEKICILIPPRCPLDDVLSRRRFAGCWA